MHTNRGQPERLSDYAGLASVIRSCSVPAAFLLNETEDLAQIEEGIRLGFNAVMVESALDREPYRQLVKKVVSLARNHDVSVEAQVGHLPNGGDTEGGGGNGRTLNWPAPSSRTRRSTHWASRSGTFTSSLEARRRSMSNV